MTSKKQTTERLRYKADYGLYCINFYGSGLKAIKDEFTLQIRTGLRQPLFVLDLEEIHEELGKPSRNSKIKNELKENFSSQLINKIKQAIQGFCKEYEIVTNKLKEELKFDLNQYWQSEETENFTLGKASKLKEKAKTKESQPSKGSNGTKELSCTSSLIAREHNRVGNPPLLRRRKYIKDEPTLSKLYIIILGQMSKHFYTDLLRHDLPLEGIVNFIPTESKYDIMLGNNKLRTYIENTFKNLKSLFDEIRQEIATKSVGLLTHELPVISNCLALKNSREIFDQLTWSIYDIDILKKQYEKFYFKPFQVIDVDIPVSENLRELYYVAESMSMRGQFQKSKLPISGTDLATIVSYLDGLLSTCGGLAVGLVANLKHTPFLNNESRNSFSSITKIHKFERLVLDANNKVLLNMLQYIDREKFWSIYLSCLEYNLLRQYVIPPLKGSTSNSIKQKTGDFQNFTLPKYVKYYTNEDCCCQRTEDLLNEHDDYEILNVSPGYRLYIFKRNFNVLIEQEDKMVIPTRLCFRDFTLYKMKEFLDNLKTSKSKTNTSTGIDNSESNAKSMELDENVLFIRPNSIKAHNLEIEGASTENKSRKRESKTKIGKKEKKSSLTKSIFESEEWLGLPPDNHLLKGYNLEDTLQEVKCKISKYYYHHGFVKLYEEKWCFQEMNKLLTLFINNATIFFSSPRQELKGISNNIRLLTKNDISIRILNDPKECSKIVMNYPNGLSVFYNEKNCEQVWFSEETPRDERRRIYTLCGAVIVFFKSSDMIMIARYNGEVYRLYQNELGEEEEEQSFATDLGNVQEKSSSFRDLKAQGDTLFVNKNQNFPDHNLLGRQREKTRKRSKLSTINNEPSRNSERLLGNESLNTLTKSNSTVHNLKYSINSELNFLNSLCSMYDLKYLHCIITTSQGKRINLAHQGEISDGPNCSIHEWHDYFANESYCERSDGVKMIWTQDSLKCFHKDGSVFTTTIGEDLANPIKDEFELQISQSSSHNELKRGIGDNNLFMDIKDSDKNSLSENPSIFTDNENKEEYLSLDIPFTSYNCHSWVMQHSNYAGVKILSTTMANLSAHMEIFGIDGIRIYNHVKEYVGNNISEYDSVISEFEECVEDKTIIKTVVNIWIGENLHVTADQEKCEVCVIMPKYEIEKVAESDSLTLSLKYKDCISDAFKYLVNEIASFESFPGKSIQELYFMEKENKDSTRRGFEFCTSLPINSNCKHQLSNNIIELKPLNTIQESIFCNCECFEEDLNKFPRFKEDKFCYKAKQDFPRVLSANIFLKIPVQLRSLTDITKFLEPFENITFKKLRGKFQNVLNHHLKLQQKFQLNAAKSSKNWKKRHEEHERRVFNEQQRLGLYYAMNKHKIYPDYWKFMQNNEGKVKNIEFFDFIQNNCGKKK